jgi:hypothetical protein
VQWLLFIWGVGIVPTIVPVTRQNSASRANISQVARSKKSLKRLDLLENQGMSERRISV